MRPITPPVTPTVLGGIVPHHSLVAYRIDEFWQSAKKTQPDTSLIILVGPDHDDQGMAAITTTVSDRAVRQTNLHTPIIEALVAAGLARRDDQVFINEHSVYTHTPYINAYFPNARVVPVLFRADASLTETQRLSTQLQALITEPTLVVASVDFSHYLSREEASTKDIESFDALQDFDYRTMSTFNADYMDSEQSIIFVAEMVCPTHTCTWETLFHGNSADELNQNPDITTSYFSLMLHQP